MAYAQTVSILYEILVIYLYPYLSLIKLKKRPIFVVSYSAHCSIHTAKRYDLLKSDVKQDQCSIILRISFSVYMRRIVLRILGFSLFIVVHERCRTCRHVQETYKFNILTEMLLLSLSLSNMAFEVTIRLPMMLLKLHNKGATYGVILAVVWLIFNLTLQKTLVSVYAYFIRNSSSKILHITPFTYIFSE